MAEERDVEKQIAEAKATLTELEGVGVWLTLEAVRKAEHSITVDVLPMGHIPTCRIVARDIIPPEWIRNLTPRSLGRPATDAEKAGLRELYEGFTDDADRKSADAALKVLGMEYIVADLVEPGAG